MPKKNAAPSEYPQAVLQQIALLAQNIVIARKRRGETQAQWAQRLGVSQPTMARIERGDPSVSMASYVMCLWLINQARGLADLIAPANDHAALEREVARVRGRGSPGSGTAHRRGAEPATGPVAQVHEAVRKAQASRNATAAGLADLLTQKASRP